MTVGGMLANARYAQGRTVEQVSAATRIRPGIIRAMESDDLAACGGAVYARGHVRALAGELGLDPERVLAQLRDDETAPMPLIAAPARDPRRELRERRTGSWWTSALAVGVGAVGSLAVLSLLAPHDRGASPTSATAGTPVIASASRTPAARPAPVRADVRLSISVRGGQSWVSVRRSDGSRPVHQVLHAGDRAQVSDPKRLTVALGNPAVVHLTVNGRTVKVGRHDRRLVLRPEAAGTAGRAG